MPRYGGAVVGTPTRQALLEQGALLFARHGVDGVTTRQLHDAIGSRNESALHYHFGGRDGLVEAILRTHLETIEARRAHLVAVIAAEDREGDVRALVHALAAPMADSLTDPLGRAHLRLVAQMDRPALAYERPFRLVEAPAGTAVVRWLREVLAGLPEPIVLERLAALRTQLVGLFAARAQLLDERGRPAGAAQGFFLANLLDSLVAGLTVDPSGETLAAAAERAGRRPTNVMH